MIRNNYSFIVDVHEYSGLAVSLGKSIKRCFSAQIKEIKDVSAV
jgi:hypothetical protein